MSLTARGGVEWNPYRIHPVNVDITKVNNLKWRFSSRRESLRVIWGSGERDSELVNGWWLAEADKGIAKFGCGLIKCRNRTQVVGDDEALLG